MEPLISKFATELRSYGLWVVADHENLWAAHYLCRPSSEPTICRPRRSTDRWEQPHWQILFHDRLANVYGFPLEIVCETEQESGMTGAPNRETAELHSSDGFIYLCDFNGIDQNKGPWIPMDDPRWRFSNRIQNVVGAPDPHSVMHVSNDLGEVYVWMKKYNQCGEFAEVKTQFCTL